MIRVKQKGDFKKTESWLKKLKESYYDKIYHYYGKKGVQYLAAATPVDSGLTASSWDYNIVKGKDYVNIEWINTNIVDNGRYKVNVAILIQYGHATKSGGFVSGYDYINPAMKPLFEKLANAVWEEVNKVT